MCCVDGVLDQAIYLRVITTSESLHTHKASDTRNIDNQKPQVDNGHCRDTMIETDSESGPNRFAGVKSP
jgi:hypothetical protein